MGLQKHSFEIYGRHSTSIPGRLRLRSVRAVDVRALGLRLRALQALAKKARVCIVYLHPGICMAGRSKAFDRVSFGSVVMVRPEIVGSMGQEFRDRIIRSAQNLEAGDSAPITVISDLFPILISCIYIIKDIIISSLDLIYLYYLFSSEYY